ncbi:unnamed protein product [Ectocarpus sp. 4 AP-2014]
MQKKMKQEGRADAPTRTRAADTSDTMGNVPNTSVTKESKEQRTRGADSLRRSTRNADKAVSRGDEKQKDIRRAWSSPALPEESAASGTCTGSVTGRPSPSSSGVVPASTSSAMSEDGQHEQEERRVKAVDEAPSPEKNEDEAAAAAPTATEPTTAPSVLLADASGIHDDVGPTPDSGSKGNDKDNDDNEQEEEKEPPLESSDNDGRSSLRTPELAEGSATTPESAMRGPAPSPGTPQQQQPSPPKRLRSHDRDFEAGSPPNDPPQGGGDPLEGGAGAAIQAEEGLRRRATSGHGASSSLDAINARSSGPVQGQSSSSPMCVAAPTPPRTPSPSTEERASAAQGFQRNEVSPSSDANADNPLKRPVTEEHGQQRHSRQSSFSGWLQTPQQAGGGPVVPHMGSSASGGGRGFHTPDSHRTAAMPSGGDGDEGIATPLFQLRTIAERRQQDGQVPRQLHPHSREKVRDMVLSTLRALPREFMHRNLANGKGDHGRDGANRSDSSSSGGGGGVAAARDWRMATAPPGQAPGPHRTLVQDGGSPSTNTSVQPNAKKAKKDRKPYRCKACGQLKNKHECPLKLVYSQVDICTTGSQTDPLPPGTVFEAPDMPVPSENGDNVLWCGPYHPVLNNHDEETGRFWHVAEMTGVSAAGSPNTGMAGARGGVAPTSAAGAYDSTAWIGERRWSHPDNLFFASSPSRAPVPRMAAMAMEMKPSVFTGNAVGVARSVRRDGLYPDFERFSSRRDSGGAAAAAAAAEAAAAAAAARQGQFWQAHGSDGSDRRARPTGFPEPATPWSTKWTDGMPEGWRTRNSGMAGTGWPSSPGFGKPPHGGEYRQSNAGERQGAGGDDLDNSFSGHFSSNRVAAGGPPPTCMTIMSMPTPSPEIMRWRESSTNSTNSSDKHNKNALPASVVIPPAIQDLEEQFYSDRFTTLSAEPPAVSAEPPAISVGPPAVSAGPSAVSVGPLPHHHSPELRETEARVVGVQGRGKATPPPPASDMDDNINTDGSVATTVANSSSLPSRTEASGGSVDRSLKLVGEEGESGRGERGVSE